MIFHFSRYGCVQVLHTFDAFGEIDTYVFRVIGPRAEIYPHFKGPGAIINLSPFHITLCNNMRQY